MNDGVTHRCTDMRNAERLVELHGNDLRFVGAWSRWIAWDGKCWKLDDTGAAMRAATATSRRLVEEALAELAVANQVFAAAPQSEAAATSRKDAERVLGWCIGSQNERRFAAMLTLARSIFTLSIRHDALDADPQLLNVLNGTLDLRTGNLRPHRRADLITKVAPVVYDAAAECPVWTQFIARAMGGDAELVGYLQRMLGYSLTGLTREHALGFFFGGGANGKSTCLSTIHAILGDYAAPAPRGLLFRAKGERHPTELASLFGRRFVTCAEIESGQAFDEAFVKDLTGGDVLSARRMREDFWSFAPTHKLFIAGNHKPIVRGDDDGTHNHFVLDRGGKVFKQSAPIIKLPKGATEDDHLALLAYLNSSTACFWMKQVMMNKGATSDRGVLQADEDKFRYEFDGTKMKSVPIPPDRHRDRLIALARELTDDSSVSVAKDRDHRSASHEYGCCRQTFAGLRPHLWRRRAVQDRSRRQSGK